VKNQSGILDSIKSSLRELERRITYGYGYVNIKKLPTYFKACSQSKSQDYRKVKVGKRKNS
jgi:hypothetical protein